MKAIVIYQAGGPDQLKLVDLPTPQLRPGWSLVKIHAFGLNHSEVYTRKGQSPTVHFPAFSASKGWGDRPNDRPATTTRWTSRHFHHGGDGAQL